MISFNKERGIASDIGDIWRSEDQEEPIEVRVTFEISDDNELAIRWTEDGETTSLYAPIERVQRLLIDEDTGIDQ